MEARREALSLLNWEEGVALPVANAENKLLEEDIARKAIDRNRFQSELTEHSSKANALRDHIKYVKDELHSTQSLLNARKKEVATEKHLMSIGERESGRLKQENQRLTHELQKLKEKRNICENDIFLANQQFESMKSQMKWDQQALEAWLEESAQKDEDALTLKKYTKEDDSKLKELGLRIEKLVKMSNEMKKNVDEETLKTMTVQVELDKTAEQFRKTHHERQEYIRQWEQIIDQMQKRDNQIESAAQQLLKMNLDYEISREELEKKKKFFDDQRNINAKLEKDIMSLDQKISELSGSLTRDKVIREQFEDELGGLKRTVERTGLDLEKSRSELSEIKKKINEKLKLIEGLKETNKEAIMNLKETIESTMTAEENAKRMEEFFAKTKQKEFQLNQEMKKRSNMQFKVNQELDELRHKQRNLEAEISGCESTLKNLDSKINKLDHDSLKQAEIIYGQDFTIQILERRIARLQGEKNNDELVALQRRIAELKTTRDERKAQYTTLLNQYKRVEDETRKAKRELDELNKENIKINTKLDELTLHNTTAKAILQKLIDEKKALMVLENEQKLDFNKYKNDLNSHANDVLELQKEQRKLESSMKERFKDIENHQSLLNTQLRDLNEQVRIASSELKERQTKVEQLKKRYDIAMISMAPPEGVDESESTQAYYVIKAAQEKEELQRLGDELDAKIKKAEKELRALENTLDVVNSNNDSYKQSYTKTGEQSELAIQKSELEQQLRTLADTYRQKRKEYKQLEEDIKQMEETYTAINMDENACEESLREKLTKVVQFEKDLDLLREQIERASKQAIRCARELRQARQTNGEATIEERDFKLRDLAEFNENKTRELADIGKQNSAILPTLNLLFNQANITLKSSASFGSLPSSTRSSRASSLSAGSSMNSFRNSERATSSRNVAKPVNIELGLPASGRSSSRTSSKQDSPKTPSSSKKS